MTLVEQSTQENVTTNAESSRQVGRRTGGDATTRQQTLEARAEEELRKSSHHAIRHVSCEVHSCVATLRGRVPSFHLKQIAQTIVRRVLDRVAIDNQVEVSEN